MSLFDKIHAIAANANIWRSQMLFAGHIPSNELLASPGLCQPVSKDQKIVLPPPSLHSISDYNMKHFFSFKNGDSFMFDPRTYPDCKSETVIRLKADIIESARKAGFRLRREGKARNRINFRCDHNKIITETTERVFKNNKHQQEGTKITTARFLKPNVSSSSKSKKSSKVARSGKNIHAKKRINATGALCKKDQCPFQMITVFCKKEQAWFLRSDCNGNIDENGSYRDPSLHRGHIKVAPENVKSDIISLSKKEIDLALNCHDLFINNQIISDLLELQRGGECRFSNKQMAYLKAKMKAKSQLDKFTSGKSTAENLLNSFDKMIKSGDDIHYISLTHSYKDGFRIANSKGRPRKVRPGECEFNVLYHFFKKYF